MKGYSLLFYLLLVLSQGFAQRIDKNIYLKSGRSTRPILSTIIIDSINKKIVQGKNSLVILQFDEMPSESLKQELFSGGIELLEYVPDNAYTALIKKSVGKELLLKAKAKGITSLKAEDKMDASLVSGLFPPHAVKVGGTVDVMLRVTNEALIEETIKYISDLRADILSKDLLQYKIIKARITAQQLFLLADQPFVEYIAPIAPPDEPLNQNNRILSHANVLNASISNGGRDLNGEGVVIGIGDDADIQLHADFAGRLINRTVAPVSGHGTHVSGTAAGAGNINELNRGYLPKATIIGQYFQGILVNAPTYVNDFGMVLTNNSYGGLRGCENNGIYDLTSAILDQQMLDMPHLQHIFAGGNSGLLTCSPFPLGFKTVLGSYQSAKNVLTVGNTTLDGTIWGTSSRGPVRDGRVKPEVTAMGTAVLSAWPGNIYAYAGGTSMSSPAVTGGAGLLYQRYRQLNGNANPKGALIKALICNGATDKGNPGPDFKYGFGSMNLLRSVDMIENNRFVSASIANGAELTHSIAVPSNTAALKVMLYWHDPAASILSAKALVNDLDLEVVNPSSTTILPLVLDSTATHVNDNAVNGVDHTNNIEQVVINNPVAGSYTIKVKGTAITQNPTQEYFVVYDVIPNSIQLTAPAGGDALVPGESVRISWDAYGDETSTFGIDYSTDGGANWNVITTGIAAGTQFYSWTVPSITTDNALIRVKKEATGQTSTSGQLVILGVPTISLSPIQCEGYFSIDWTAVAGATDYEIMLLKGSEMVSIGTTTATTFTVHGLSADSTYWISTRARVNGKWGRRAVALSRQPNNGTCAATYWDHDLKLKALISPVSGRKHTSTELTNAATISIEVKNLDDAPVTGFDVSYSIDGGNNWVTENLIATVAAGATYTHPFITKANLSSTGTYNLIAVVTNSTPDLNASNDTLRASIKHLDNQPLNLATMFVDNVEGAADSTYSSRILGIEGSDRYDFENTTSIGRLRTFVNTGLANSGRQALTMDVSASSSAQNVNFLYGTYNLSNYNTSINELRLDLQFNVHGSNRVDSNKIWIRGDDTKPWIKVYDFIANRNDYAVYKRTHSIEIADTLSKYGQQFSPSFQLRWAQNGVNATVDRGNASGVTIDDIRLYEAVNDAQMLSIDTPAYYSCGLSNAFTVKITVRNGVKNNFINVPVKYSVNSGPWITEVIPALASESSLQYSFVATADLSQYQAYVIKAVVDYPGDNIHDNDTSTIAIYNAPLVSTFPYLQDFEGGNGGWFSEGFNNSWQYGTPTSPKINRAASGSKAWKTRLSGNYNDLEYSVLNSPCFDVTGLTNPTLSFNVALDLENCGTTTCDAAWIEYSPDGINWAKLNDATGTAVNWYSGPTNIYWSVENYTRWHVVTVALPKSFNKMRLRFVFSSDPAVNREGIAIDDIHVYDKQAGIYDGATTSSSINATIAGGNNWIHFQKDGKLVASVKPNNQALGSTNVDVYINAGAVRYTATQYYGNRSITIKPATSTLPDSSTVRFYMLDSEIESLINATGCSACGKPTSMPEVAVSQYHDANDNFENGTISDNTGGLWKFHPSSKVIKVPFDKGYYLEFKVKDYSEFWISNATLADLTVLPVKLISFDAKQSGKDDVVVGWTVAEETDVNRYEIEVARSAEDLQIQIFEKIGEAAGGYNTAIQKQYQFIDKEPLKTGVRYYRLKVIEKDGSYFYSATKSIVFNSVANWKVSPNPSSGKFYFVYHLNNGEVINMQLTDAIGKVIKRYSSKGDGQTNKKLVDISDQRYAPGIYFLHVYKNGKKESLKLYKQ